MKNFKNLLIVFGMAVAVMSCSDKDEPKPLKDVEFGLFAETKTMEVAQTLMTSENEYAADAGFLINTVNPVAYSAFFTVPQGATKINGAITATNARTNANVVTYEWTSQQGGIAYQVTEQSDSYYYEIFMKYEADGPYYKWYEGSQAKDRRSGYLIVLDATENERTEMIRYDFEYRSDNSLYITYVSEFYNIEALFNPDKSGYLKQFAGDNVSVEYHWTGAGSGSWATYDEAGEVNMSGTW